jgi:protein tyrosine/serine phosphatase
MRVAAIFFLMGALACMVRAGAEDTPPAAKAKPVLAQPRQDVPGVGNFAKISEALYRGEQPTAEGMAELKKMGVKTVVNLRAFHSDRDELKGLGLNYVHINCKAWHPEDEDVARFLKIVNMPENQPVFVHCQHGSDRTGLMVAAYRMVEQGWSAGDAVAEIRNFGFHEIFQNIITHLEKWDVDAIRVKAREVKAPKIRVVK